MAGRRLVQDEAVGNPEVGPFAGGPWSYPSAKFQEGGAFEFDALQALSNGPW